MMKKWLSLFLALCMMALALPVLGEVAAEENLFGLWQLYLMQEGESSFPAELLKPMGIGYSLEIRDDGTATFYDLGNDVSTDGSWEVTDEGFILTINDSPAPVMLVDGMIYIQDGETLMVFTADDGSEATASEETASEEDLASLLALLGGDGEATAEGDSADMTALLGSLGSLLGGSEGEESDAGIGDLLGSLLGGSKGSEGESADLSGLLGSLGSLLGGSEGEEGSADLSALIGSFGSLLGSSEGEEGSADLSGLLGSLGSLLGGSDGETRSTGDGEESGEFDVSALISLFGAILGGEDSAEVPAFNFIEAESIEEFYGDWELTGAILGETMLSLDSLKAMDLETSDAITISEAGVVGTATISEEKNESTELAPISLEDGKLKEESEDNTVYYALTDTGELVVDLTIMQLIFVRVTAE